MKLNYRQKKNYYKAAIFSIFINFGFFLVLPYFAEISKKKNVSTNRIVNLNNVVFKSQKEQYKQKQIQEDHISKKINEPMKIKKKMYIKPKPIKTILNSLKVKNIDFPKFQNEIQIDYKTLPTLNYQSAEISTTDFNIKNSGIPVLEPKILDVTKLDKKPVIKFKIKPIYPYAARNMGIEGTVLAEFIVDENGDVHRIRILKSEPEKFFEESVKIALSKYKFFPGEKNGKKIKSVCRLKINFNLDE
jgi:protein TonB